MLNLAAVRVLHADVVHAHSRTCRWTNSSFTVLGWSHLVVWLEERHAVSSLTWFVVQTSRLIYDLA